MDDTTAYVVDLYKDGVFYAQRSMFCGEVTFRSAVAQWERNGFVVKVISQPKKG